MHLKKKDWDVADVVRQLRSIHRQASSPYNDGFTASGCKHDLFQIKCIIEDLYADTPTFANEEEWQEQRTLDLLSRKNNGNRT
jgi:hypothetical protein